MAILLGGRETAAIAPYIPSQEATATAAAEVSLPETADMQGRWKANEGEVLDTVTGLAWRRCSVGMLWDGNGHCSGRALLLSFDEARGLVDEQWRTPTKEELATLVDAARARAGLSPAIDPVVFPDARKGPLWYWTRTLNDMNPYLGVVVVFSTGFINPSAYRTNRFAVRMVRSKE